LRRAQSVPGLSHRNEQAENKSAAGYQSVRSAHLSARSYWQALCWSTRQAWDCSGPLTSALFTTNLLSSTIPAISTLALGALIHRLNQPQADPGDISLWLVIAVAIFLIGAWIEGLQNYCQERLTDELNLFVQEKLYRHAGTLDLAFFENSNSLDQLFRMRTGVLRGLLGPMQATIGGVSGILQTVSLLGLMIWYQPLPAVILMAASFPLVAVQLVVARQKYQLELETTRSRRWSNYFSSLMTEASVLPTIRLFKLEPLLLGQFGSVLEDVNQRRHHLHQRKAAMVIATSTIFFFALIAVMLWLGARMSAGSLAASELVIFGLAAFRARTSVAKVVNSIGNGMDSVFVVNHFLDFLNVHSDKHPGGQLAPDRITGHLQLEQVSFRYPGTNRQVLQDVSLNILAGQTVAIVGPNGAGKTSLVKLICRLYDPTGGRITLDGADLREYSSDNLKNHLSLVQQRTVKFEATVRDIISYGNWERFQSEPEALEEFLNNLPIRAFIDSLPDGLDTLVGKQFGNVTLSEGQWQQLSIARAMASEASILILDEPMANLDAVAEREMFDWVCQLGTEQTIILVSHRFSTVQMADRIVVLEDGHVVEDGTHDELLERDGLYGHMYKSYYGLKGLSTS